MVSIEELLAIYKTKGVLIDANLLLVYFVGLYDPNRIKQFKRTEAFTIDDFSLLARLVDWFSKIVTTPNVLTEVNSLSNQLRSDLKSDYYLEFAKQIVLLEEHYVSSEKMSSSASFNRFGLTDSAIAELAQGQFLVLSDDFRLVGHLQKVGIDAINFNHIRYLAWQ